jgi:addiction module HigA family antidote
MIRIPTNRPPTHPGEMLFEEFLLPLGLTQREVANALHVPYSQINELVNRHRRITPGLALRLAKFFEVSADFWMNLQLRWDLYVAQQDELKELQTIHPYHSKAEMSLMVRET